MELDPSVCQVGRSIFTGPGYVRRDSLDWSQACPVPPEDWLGIDDDVYWFCHPHYAVIVEALDGGSAGEGQ